MGFDDITADQLRALGGLKWSAFEGKVGAFVAESDLGTAPEVTQALSQAVSRGLFGYLSATWVRELTQAFTGFARDQYDWSIDAEHVFGLGDVLTGLTGVIEHFSAPGTPVIVPTPAYMPFLEIPPALGRAVHELPMASDGAIARYDLDALDAALAAGGPGTLLILCNPHNPIGRVLERAELAAISEIVDRRGGRVFADEIHAPLMLDGRRHVPYATVNAAAAAHTITATSASKAWNVPGLKCAQLIVSNHADRQTWLRVGERYERGTATLGVLASTAAYRAGAAEGSWLSDVLRYLAGSRDLLADLVAEHLPGVGMAPVEGTYLAWWDFRALALPGGPAAFFAEHADVVLTDGRRCGAAGQGFARYTFATPRPIMAATIERMGAALAAR